LEIAQNAEVATLTPASCVAIKATTAQSFTPILGEITETESQVKVVYRQAGDKYLLVEYGPLVLDLTLRFRIHALMQWLEKENVQGILNLTPGIRSLQVHYDSLALPVEKLLTLLKSAEDLLPAVEEMEVPTRIVHLPLSWDDAATKLAIEKYMQSVRKDAPWCPSNIEFIRRINGLDSIEDLKQIVFGASYLTLGLGDVYLGAPVATPVDPRHRLVTTKYNPARTWTPENAVGIGGAYMCVYGMEGPGGYQFVGRTIQMWNRWNQTKDFKDGRPWLLRFFDQIRFYSVTEAELLQMREDFPRGKFQLNIEEQTFKLKDYTAFLDKEAESIATFKGKQQASFDAERERWIASGQASYSNENEAGQDVAETLELADGSAVVSSHVAGNLWQIKVNVGDEVAEGDVVVVVESMKMEISVAASCSGKVTHVLCQEGGAVAAGQQLLVIAEK